MYVLKQIKFFLAIFLCITSVIANHCMITQFKHKPLTQEPDLLTKIQRDRIEKLICFSEKRPLNFIKDLTIVREATKEEQKGTCFHYAITKVTGNTESLTMYRKDNKQTSTINIEKYFKQTADPQVNDIALYTDNEKSYLINHCAVVFDTDKNIFESKFGQNKNIIHHQPFAVPIFYGNAISYWTLKLKYQYNKKKLRKTIREDALAFNNDEQQPHKKQKFNYVI